MTLSTTSLAFPHPELTTITSEPTSSSLRFLQRELHANARQIHSTRGGGVNGHLRLVMTEADYFARAQVNFVAPQQFGDAPHHIHPATGLQIAETIRLFAQNADEHRRYHLVASELKKQILQAVPHRCLQILEDDDFGFTDVSPLAMLQHLQATCGQVRPDDLENNLSTPVTRQKGKCASDWTRVSGGVRFLALPRQHARLSHAGVHTLAELHAWVQPSFGNSIDEWNIRHHDPLNREMGEIVSAASRTALLNRHGRESSRSCALSFDGFSNQNSKSWHQVLANDS
jgi:hypothetical protein